MSDKNRNENMNAMGNDDEDNKRENEWYISKDGFMHIPDEMEVKFEEDKSLDHEINCLRRIMDLMLINAQSATDTDEMIKCADCISATAIMVKELVNPSPTSSLSSSSINGNPFATALGEAMMNDLFFDGEDEEGSDDGDDGDDDSDGNNRKGRNGGNV